MAQQAYPVGTSTSANSSAQVYESPPLLPTHISAAELAATEGGPGRAHARGLSSRAAVIAGAIGGALFGAVVFGAKSVQRGLKVTASAFAGGMVGKVISTLPWSGKRHDAEPVAQTHPLTLPNLPNVPTPQPTPHPAAPGTAVESSEIAGRVEVPAQATSVSI